MRAMWTAAIGLIAVVTAYAGRPADYTTYPNFIRVMEAHGAR